MTRFSPLDNKKWANKFTFRMEYRFVIKMNNAVKYTRRGSISYTMLHERIQMQMLYTIQFHWKVILEKGKKKSQNRKVISDWRGLQRRKRAPEGNYKGVAQGGRGCSFCGAKHQFYILTVTYTMWPRVKTFHKRTFHFVYFFLINNKTWNFFLQVMNHFSFHLNTFS